MSRQDELSEEDNERVHNVSMAMQGHEETQKALTEKHLGTRDLDEADRRTRVIWEWRDEHEDSETA